MEKARFFSFLALACVIGAVVWGGAAGASEFSPEWQVTKAGVKQSLKFKESEPLSEAVTTTSNWVWKQLSGAGVAVECTVLKTPLAVHGITGTRGFESGSILFEGCKVVAPAGDTTCEVSSTGFPNGQIRTQAGGFRTETALEGSTLAPRIKLEPVSTREEIVTLHLEGASCANKGTAYEVAGHLVGNIDSSAQKKAHRWTFTKTSGTQLKISGVESEFSGAGEFTLKSGNEWGDG